MLAFAGFLRRHTPPEAHETSTPLALESSPATTLKAGSSQPPGGTALLRPGAQLGSASRRLQLRRAEWHFPPEHPMNATDAARGRCAGFRGGV